MKTTRKNTKNILMLLALSSSLASFQALAQNEDAILNSDPININGYIHEQVAPTDHELESVKNNLNKVKGEIVINKEKSKKYKELGKSTEKLSEVTEDMIEERNEAKDTWAKYNKKIECLMQETPGKDCDEFIKNKNKSDKVSTAQAAPAVVETEVSAPRQTAIKVLPYAGYLSHSGKKETLEASYDVGIRAEADVNARFSIGAGIGYNTLTTRDFAFSAGNYYNNYGNGYFNAYGSNGREIEYSNLKFDLYSKFFIVDGDRFRPYVGAGVVYNRASMNYKDNANYNYVGYNFGDEKQNFSYMSGMLMGGVEISFTKMIGLNAEVNYSRGLSGNLSNDQRYNNLGMAPDQFRLKELRDELVDANVIGVNLSLLIKF